MIKHTTTRRALLSLALTLSLIGSACVHTSPAPAAKSTRASSYDADLVHIEAALALFAQAPDQARFERGLERLAQVRQARSLRIHQDALEAALRPWPYALRAVPDRWKLDEAPRDELTRWLWRLPRHLDVMTLAPELLALSAPHTQAIVSFSVSGDERLKTLLTRRAQAGIKRLELSQLTMSALDALLKWPQRAGLEELIFWDLRLGPGLSQALVQAGSWPALKALDVGSNRLGEQGVSALGRLEAPKLEVLRLDWNAAADDGVLGLLSSSHHKLKVLGLDHNNLSAKAIRAIVASEHLSALETLTLEGNPLTDEGALALSSRADRLGALKRLKLGQTQLTANACAALSALNAPSLAHLDVSENALTDACTLELLKANYIPRLRALLISKAELTSQSAAALAQEKTLSLAALDLSQNRLDERGCQQLMTSSALKRLEALSLAQNEVGPGCAASIARQAAQPDGLRELISLDLSQTGLNDEALVELLKSPLSGQLITLKLSWNPLERAAQTLSQAKLTALSQLSLEGVTLKDDSNTPQLQTLLTSQAFAHLTQLNLGWCGLDDASLEPLARWDGLGRLEALSLKGNAFNADALKAFIERTQHKLRSPGPSQQLMIDFTHLLHEP